VLVAYIMKPKAGYDYLATAAHFAAESSTGTNVNVCTTDDFTKSVDALVYYIDPDNEEMKIAYPTLLFDRNITDGRGMMCSFLTLAIGNNQGNSSPLGLLLLVPSLLFSGFVVLLCSSL
jgi:ribulose-bisphosphate carboxylase large chain